MLYFKIKHQQIRLLRDKYWEWTWAWLLLIVVLLTFFESIEDYTSISNVYSVSNEVITTVQTKELEKVEPILTFEQKVIKEFGENSKIMLAIIKAESNFKKDAFNVNTNKTWDYGYFQINSCHGYTIEELQNEDRQIEVAKIVFEKQGFEAWSAYNNNSFKKYL